MNNQWFHKIFSLNNTEFESLALEVFNFQYEYNPIYRAYVDELKIRPHSVNQVVNIPFLPIQFFKTHEVKATSFEPEAVFESSGTTKTVNSHHFVKDIRFYKESFLRAFELFYGPIDEWCVIGLLPSYLERKNSSLVFMVDELIRQSHHDESGFYLYQYESLHNNLLKLEKQHKKTLLIGVSFALLDFVKEYPLSLSNTTIMETGGMKGRKEEMVRDELHNILKQGFGVGAIHSEYGMTELLSQAYSKGGGIFHCPPWMKIFIRDEEDPLTIRNDSNVITGGINIIDLANIYSCSFIATEDAGKLYPDQSFEVLGRLDNSDIRGCSLMIL